MTKILILGGGFGGVRVALDLSKKFKGRKDVQITLLDKADSQTFTPALYEIASIYGVDHQHPFHGKLRGAICIPYREIFAGKKVELVQAEVTHIDLEQKHIVTSAGNTLGFDYLVIALGATMSTFGVKGAEEYAYKFKTIEDGLMVNDKVEQLYREASRSERQLPINIIIAGAGFNGVELAAELSNCTVHAAHKHKIAQRHCTSINLLEAGPTILPMILEKNRHIIESRLKKLRINIMVNSAVEEVGPDFVRLKPGSRSSDSSETTKEISELSLPGKDGGIIKGDLIVWSGGVKPLELFKKVPGLELDERGRIIVDGFMRAKNHDNIFAVGDNIIFYDPKTQKPILQMAYLAIEQGTIAARNIMLAIERYGGTMPEGKNEKRVEGEDLKKYKPSYPFWIAPVGGKYAVAHLGRWGTHSGFVGYLIKQAADLRYFLSILPFWKGLKMFCEDVRVFSKND